MAEVLRQSKRGRLREWNLLEPTEFLEVFERECPRPFAELLGDELLKDFCERILRSEILKSGGLIDQADDSDLS